jgi:hypothetical protein
MREMGRETGAGRGRVPPSKSPITCRPSRTVTRADLADAVHRRVGASASRTQKRQTRLAKLVASPCALAGRNSPPGGWRRLTNLIKPAR